MVQTRVININIFFQNQYSVIINHYLLLFSSFINPTLYGGGHSVPPPKVLVSGAFQNDLRDPRCWHNSYMIMRIDFMKKKFQNFFKIFFNFFQFFGHPSHTKRFFCTFGPKITYSYILGGQHVHLTSKKCFLEAHSTKCPWNAPRKYPDISEPVQGRVK